uniref:Nudix hydrolase domain-containing protein n=1 Tax=Ganoderma boninense TaxID=34458 RepID=A0A5K1K4V0_9APHY|nr:Uncharacterized protein [Ganoderma boninense]
MSSLFGDRRAYTVLGAAAVAIAALPAIYVAVKNKLKYRRVEKHLTSREFVLAAGAVAFQFDASGAPKRVLLAHHAPLDAWLLSKGRKDEGEDLATTAIREVFEETGYLCRLHSVPHLPTCAPLPAELAGMDCQSHSARIASNSSEPFMIASRPCGVGMLKLIFWYIGAVDVPYEEDQTSSSTHQPGSHQLAEGFDEIRLFDIDEAIKKLAFDGDRVLVRTAVGILTTPP